MKAKPVAPELISEGKKTHKEISGGISIGRPKKLLVVGIYRNENSYSRVGIQTRKGNDDLLGEGD